MEIDFKNVTGIAVDSREVKPGFIFIAVKGNALDGHNYIDQAILNGANIIIHQSEVKYKENIQYIKVNDSRIALSEIAAEFYTKQPKYILGITGTSGKSSIVHFIREILRLMKKKAVSIGTLGILGDLAIKSSLTTPATIDLHQILQEISVHNIDYVAIECSSHGVDQHRLDKIKFSACGFSNFSRDHLDYHANMQEYLSAKKQLFYIMKNGNAVLNIDIPEYKEIYQICLDNHHKILSYGKNDLSDIKIKKIDRIGSKQRVYWQILNKNYVTDLDLFGEFQVYNIACAIGLLASININIEQIMEIISMLPTVPGRMEFVAEYNGAGIFVDYAHKPEALEQVLINLRTNTEKKLWLIFGCGGERDQGKRAIMGDIACNLADHVVITDDNPRNEDPQKIREDILLGCKNRAFEVASREKAIEFALLKLNPGDNLLIAGKGHETYQLVGKDILEFSDKEKVKEIILHIL